MLVLCFFFNLYMSASKYVAVHNKDVFITYTANSGTSFYDQLKILDSCHFFVT